MARLSVEEKTKQLDALKGVLIQFDLDERSQPDHVECHQTHEEFLDHLSNWQWQHRRGIIEAIRDCHQMLKEMDMLDYYHATLDRVGLAHEVDVNRLVGTWSKTAKKALRAGRVTTETEYRAVNEYLTELTETDDSCSKHMDLIHKFEALLEAYEDSILE